MYKTFRVFALLALLIASTAFRAGGRFDGKWDTTLTCDPYQDALGFTWQFVSEVKDDTLHGLYGSEGQPASIVIDGPVAEDGSAKLNAKVWTGARDYVPGHNAPKGTEFTYHIKAQFQDATGKGTRIEGRPCRYEFKRK